MGSGEGFGRWDGGERGGFGEGWGGYGEESCKEERGEGEL